MILYDGLDRALLGIGGRCGEPDRAIYDYDKLIATLMATHDWSHAEAIDWAETNITNAWLGPETPVILYRMSATSVRQAVTDPAT